MRNFRALVLEQVNMRLCRAAGRCVRTRKTSLAQAPYRATVALHAPADMPAGCVLAAGGADGLALLTPAATQVGHRAGGARLGLGTVRHLHGAYTGAERGDGNGTSEGGTQGRAPLLAAPPVAMPGPAFLGAAIRGAAAGPAWVISAHADGALRA